MFGYSEKRGEMKLSESIIMKITTAKCHDFLHIFKSRTASKKINIYKTMTKPVLMSMTEKDKVKCMGEGGNCTRELENQN